MIKRKKGQHHVWKAYLKAWAIDGQVGFLMDCKPFQRTDPIRLAVENYFYKLPEINSEDEKLIRWLVISAATHPSSKILHENFLKMLTVLPRFIEAKRHSIKNLPEVEEMLEIYRCNILEEHHCSVEERFLPLLDMIYREDISFYDDDNKVVQFFYFICIQHMRTKGIKTRTISNLKEKNGIDLTRIWDVVSPMLAVNLGGSLYCQRKSRKLVLLKNTTEVEFITGDQPTINLEARDGELASAIVTYYPVSPVLALILTETDGKSPFSTETLTSAQVAYLNARMVKTSHRQIFGRSESALINAWEDGAKPAA